METYSVQTAVCKTVQALGLSPRKEHQIENALAIQIRASGPEFVLSRLSALSDWRKAHMSGNTSYYEPWFKIKRHNGCCTPADALGSQIWQLSDKAFFATVGAIRKSVELAVPTEKQLTKWKDGVRCENNSDSKRIFPKVPSYQLVSMERALRKAWSKRDWFNVSDVTGTNIPGSGKFVMVKVDKSTSEKKPLSLLSAYEFSLSTAPLFVWQFLEEIESEGLLSLGRDNAEELHESLTELIRSKKSDYRLIDEAEMGSSWVDDETFLRSPKIVDYQFGFCHSVGNIGFLQQEGGKLRTVANPNRLVQYVNVPLGEVLSDWCYRQPEVHVKNQRDGLLWAQGKLREGESLSSFDMSSATDRLDYRKYLQEAFELVYDTDQYPLLKRSLELFEDTSASPWSIPGHVADLLGVSVPEVSWTVGQPLGLRPSFPLLTAMNSSFARQAVVSVDGKYSHGHFACVGDDLIIESKYADAYMKYVQACNGKINNDKCIVSDRYAEFCSQMITRSTIFPIKPRFQTSIEGSLNNIEKFSVEGLNLKTPRWVRTIHDRVSAWFLPGCTCVPYTVSSAPKSLMERLGVNTLIQVTKTGSRDTDHISLQTLYLRALEEKGSSEGLSAKDLSSSYASSAYESFGGSKVEPAVKTTYSEVGSPIKIESLGKVSSDSGTSVPKQIATEWDFRDGQYKPKYQANELSTAKSLIKSFDEMSLDVEDSIVTVTQNQKGVETTIMVDTSPDNPEVLVGHRVDGHESVQVVEPDFSDETLAAINDYKASRRRIPDSFLEIEEKYDALKQGSQKDDSELNR